MADDKDKKLKEAEEALEKAQEEALKTPPPPVESFSRAQWNPELLRLRAGEGNKFEPTVSDASAHNVYSSQSDKIVAQQRNGNGKGKKTPEEKDANKAAKVKKDAAVAYAQYKRNLARAAQQAKDESEHIRSIREHHEKDMPSFAEGLLAKVSGGMTGVLLGTFKRERAVSEAAEQEITIFKDRMKIQADIRKGAATARNERAAGRVSSVLSLSERNAISGATNVLTSIAFGTKLFEDGKNPLVGIGPNTNKDTPAQVRDWWAKTSKKAFGGNKKAQREMGAASSRIADRKARLLPEVEKDDLRRDNKNIYKEKVYASVPTLLGEPEVMMDSISHIWHDEVAIKKQIDDWETLKAYHQMFDALAASADPEGEYALFAGAWADEKNKAERSDILGNVNAMKDMAEKFKVTITSQQRNLKGVKDAGRKVADINAKIKGLEKGNEADQNEADRMRENELPEAEQDLNLTLLFSGHSDLKVRRGEDGGVEVYDAGTNVKLIKQSFTRDGRSAVDVNHEYIESLPEKDRPAARKLAEAAVNRIERGWGLTPPATSPDSEGPALDELKYNAWKSESPEEFAIVQEGIEAIVTKIVDEEITYAEAKLGVGLNEREQQIMRSPYAKHMLLLWKADDDKGN